MLLLLGVRIASFVLICPFQSLTHYQTEAISGKDRTVSRNWGYMHNNCLLAYTIYYKDGKLDPNLPPARSPIDIAIPQTRPPVVSASTGVPLPQSMAQPVPIAPAPLRVAQQQEQSGEERQAILAEVRQHLDILKELEGSVPEETINKRKRELFAALPDAPPPAKK